MIYVETLLNRIFWIVFFLTLNAPLTVFAQSELSTIWGDTFFATERLEKITLVSRSPKEIETQTKEMEILIRDAMYESGRFSLVKDGRDISHVFKAKQILETQDLIFLCILDGYAAPKITRFEFSCFRKTDKDFLRFLGSRDDLKAFVGSKVLIKAKVIVQKPSEILVVKKVETNKVGNNVVEKTKKLATQRNDEKRLYFDPTRKDSRRILVGRKRRRLDQSEFYELVGEPQLKEAYLEKGTLRTTLFIVGSTAIAVGAGLIFGSVFSNAKCGNDESCKSNILTIIGGTSLGLGGISIATGFLINRYPTSSKEDKEAIDLYNENPKKD